MKVLNRGAEAVIAEIDFMGRKAVLKERIKKGYRLPILDEELRSQRTKKEVKLLHEAKKAGVNVPVVFFCGKYSIIMEKIAGDRLKEYLERGGEREIMKKVGEDVGKLHMAGIAHGDLTTSNIFVVNGEPVFIDFGLGEFTRRLEDFAVDLVVFKKTLQATHAKDFDTLWKYFLEGYAKTCSFAHKVLERAKEVEKRARYL